MKFRSQRSTRIVAIIIVLLLALSNGAVYADGPGGDDLARYRVTVQNLTPGQPFSPPVAATHQGGIRMFRVGQLASAELEDIAEDGNQMPMFDLFNASGKVTQAVNVGMPLTPSGTTVMGFTDSVSFEIEARSGDKFSMATMLICTNDGFTGLDRAKLPKKGSRVFLLSGYDAGTEDNTEKSLDIVDPCSGLGPLPLFGDPNGNDDATVDSDPHQPVQHHPNIMDIGDLTVGDHGWTSPVAKVTITRLAVDDEDEFETRLSSDGEVPPVETEGTGKARFELENDGHELEFDLKVSHIEGVVQAHIHMGLPNENKPVVAFLFGPVAPTGTIDGRLARGTITESDLIGPLAGDFAGFVEALRNGELYVNVHTAANPGGELRGQIGTGD